VTTTHISMARAKATFSAMVDGVAHRGERYVVERHGRVAAALVTPGDLGRLARTASLASEASGAMALVGLWHDVGDDAFDVLGDRLRDRRRGAVSPVEPSP